jgi:predicted lipid-binding transport protein (Tim44 family)
MKRWILGVCAALLAGVFVAEEVEAKRLGGARSSGVQRSVTPPPAKPAQQAAPNQQNATQGAQNAAPAGAAQPAASGLGRFAPILGGLAIGGMLGYLFGGNGLMGILLLAALAFVAVMAIRAFARRGQQAPQRMQYAGMGDETVAAPPPSQSSGLDLPRSAPAGANAAALPANFDAASFLKAAKLNFIRLQAANDTGRTDEIREFMTDELFEDLKRDIRGGQQTDVASLQAELLEVSTAEGKHWASVHFSGTIRETPGAQTEGFEEVWNLVKPADGSSGWLLAGIQQMH